jgi:hypothetical protein
MTASRITLALVVLYTLAMTACTAGPEESLAQALDALCSGEDEAFLETLTTDSKRLYHGLTLANTESFGCSNNEQLRLEALDTQRPDVKYFRVLDGTRTTRVAMVLEEGAWRMDLFFSEEAEFFLQNDRNNADREEDYD